MFYVYAYLRKDGSPYYIGKGKGRRAYTSDKWRRTPKDKTRIQIVRDEIDEMTAFFLERFWIAVYGRKDLDTGILYNKSEGGEGSSGTIVSVETRIKRSETHKNRSPEKELLRRKRASITKRSYTDEERKIISNNISNAKKGKIQKTAECSHCGKIGGYSVMHRHHFDNCKQRRI